MCVRSDQNAVDSTGGPCEGKQQIPYMYVVLRIFYPTRGRDRVSDRSLERGAPQRQRRPASVIIVNREIQGGGHHIQEGDIGENSPPACMYACVDPFSCCPSLSLWSLIRSTASFTLSGDTAAAAVCCLCSPKYARCRLVSSIRDLRSCCELRCTYHRAFGNNRAHTPIWFGCTSSDT